MKIGYARVSTTDQSLDLQINALRASGVRDNEIYSDTISATSNKRPGLRLAMNALRPGDVFVVWRLDRLARSLDELIRLTQEIKDSGCEFVSLTESFDTNTAGGRMMFQMLGVLAEFERNLIVERTVAGLKAARERGQRFGRKPVMTDDRIHKAALLSMKGYSPLEIARRIGVGKSSVYNYKDEIAAAIREIEASSKK